MYSVVATCKQLGIDPFAYLREVLPALFALGDKTREEAVASWLPDVWRQRQPPSLPKPPPTPAESEEVPAVETQ